MMKKQFRTAAQKAMREAQPELGRHLKVTGKHRDARIAAARHDADGLGCRIGKDESKWKR